MTHAQNTLRSNQLDQLVGDGPLSVPLTVGGDVAEVSDVTFLVVGSSVGLGVRVDCRGAG